MKKILLIDHWGSCDSEGKPIGHTLKVINEYKNILKDNYEVSAAMPECMSKELASEGFEDVYSLKYSICEAQPKSIYEKIVDKLKVFYNLHEIRKIKGYDIVWYIRADFFMLFYMLLHKKVREYRVYTLIYHSEYGNGLLGRILKCIQTKSLEKFDGIIYTQKGMKIKHKNIFYMPDYIYDENKYEKYIPKVKKEKVVCVGTINSDKDIEGLVEVFNQNGYLLEIMGRFLDDKRFEDLQRIAKSNITIINKVLTDEEYYTKLGEAKYSILPYKMKAYAGRTSGVLQESMFVNTIPIAPGRLLEQNGIAGYGYGELEELKSFAGESISHENIFLRNLQENSEGEIVKRLQEFIEKGDF